MDDARELHIDVGGCRWMIGLEGSCLGMML